MSLIPLVDSDFHAIIIESFLSGIYLILLVQAIRKLLRRQAYGLYIVALIVLWMSCNSLFIFDWVRARNAFVLNGHSPVSILTAIATFAINSGTPYIPVILSNIISDGILIWRCHVLWKNKWIMVTLITMLAASTFFMVLVAVLPLQGVQLRLLSAALGTLLSVATTVLSTLLIALRIILVTRESHCYYSYTKVIEILVESAAMQSVVFLFSGLLDVIELRKASETTVLLGAYIGPLRRMIVGIGPTLIAFRVADEQQRTEVHGAGATGPGSHLAFKHSKNSTETGAGIASQRTWVSTICFQAAQRETDSKSICPVFDSEDGLSVTESPQRITRPDYSYNV